MAKMITRKIVITPPPIYPSVACARQSGNRGMFKKIYMFINLGPLRSSLFNKLHIFSEWIRYFVWNFKGYLWNSTQNILPTHWKYDFFCTVKNSKSHRFKSSYAHLNWQKKHNLGQMWPYGISRPQWVMDNILSGCLVTSCYDPSVAAYCVWPATSQCSAIHQLEWLGPILSTTLLIFRHQGNYDIMTGTERLPFCRRHFQMYFL